MLSGENNMMRVTARAGRGKYAIQGVVQAVDDGIIALIVGGTKPHIGSVAVALPRPSLADPSKVSATTSVFNIVGHKDEEIARPAAQLFASRLDKVTVVVAGVHVDGASEKDIEHLLANSEKVTMRLLDALRVA